MEATPIVAAGSATRHNDALDELTQTTAQLAAVLHLMSGAGFQSFDDLSAEYRSNALWAAAALAERAKAAAQIVAGGNAA